RYERPNPFVYIAPPNRGSLQQRPHLWHSRAGGGAVHSIINGSYQLHSINSSASASILSEMVRPSTFAVLRLMTRSNLVGCSTGISPGFVPRRILSTISAARRNKAGKFG